MAYTIAETAKKFGLTAYTLRYYDKEGLLPFIERTASGFRSFSDTDLEWLKIIMCLKNTGMTIKDIKQFINLCKEGESTYKERLEFLQRQKENIERQMADLQKNYETILYKVQYYKNAINS